MFMQRTFGAVQYSLKPQRINTLHILPILPILHLHPPQSDASASLSMTNPRLPRHRNTPLTTMQVLFLIPVILFCSTPQLNTALYSIAGINFNTRDVLFAIVFLHTATYQMLRLRSAWQPCPFLVTCPPSLTALRVLKVIPVMFRVGAMSFLWFLYVTMEHIVILSGAQAQSKDLSVGRLGSMGNMSSLRNLVNYSSLKLPKLHILPILPSLPSTHAERVRWKPFRSPAQLSAISFSVIPMWLLIIHAGK